MRVEQQPDLQADGINAEYCSEGRCGVGAQGARQATLSRPDGTARGLSAGCLPATARDKYNGPRYLPILTDIEKALKKHGIVSVVLTEHALYDPVVPFGVSDTGLDGPVMMRPWMSGCFSSRTDTSPTSSASIQDTCQSTPLSMAVPE